MPFSDEVREMDLESSDGLIMIFVDPHTLRLLVVNHDVGIVPKRISNLAKCFKKLLGI